MEQQQAPWRPKVSERVVMSETEEEVVVVAVLPNDRYRVLSNVGAQDFEGKVVFPGPDDVESTVDLKALRPEFPDLTPGWIEPVT